MMLLITTALSQPALREFLRGFKGRENINDIIQHTQTPFADDSTSLSFSHLLHLEIITLKIKKSLSRKMWSDDVSMRWGSDDHVDNT